LKIERRKIIMAMSKIERIEKEIQKTREKITEYQNKLRGLEAQKSEAENLQIVQLVRSMRLTPQELTAMLSGGGIPGIAPIPADYEEQEETENEE
jgi:conjugal transfer/entry exclusion protein